MEKLRKMLNGNETDLTEEEGITGHFNEIPSLSWSTRIQWFIGFFLLGFILCILGISTLFLPGGIKRFAVCYALGNGFSLTSTIFLMGPWKQLKKMFNESRYLATLGVLFFIVLTLMAAFKQKLLLCIIFCICEFLSMIWYSISYIPFARDAVRKAIVTVI